MLPDWLFSALIVLGFLTVLLGPVLILLLPDLGRYRGLHGMLQRLALKGVGKLDDVVDGPLPMPRLTASGGGRAFTVMPDAPQEDDHPGSILFEMSGPLPLPRLEVHPRDPAARSELAGLTGFSLGDALMDRDYIGMIADATAWERLAPKVSLALERLGRCGEKPWFALSCTAQRIQIRRLNPPKDDAEIEALMVRVAELLEALVDAQAAPVSAAPDVPCHYCGVTLALVEVRCRRCSTAYHGACFRAPGGCTLYPCTCATPISEADGVPLLPAAPATDEGKPS